jgi:ATP-binding cassette, subfamily B, bacterial
LSPRARKFLSYYRPYLGIFALLMAGALIVAATTLLFPLGTRFITKTVLAGDLAEARPEIYRVGAWMLGLIVLQAACSYFVDYRGHAMGAMMEGDMRAELFAHYQKLSFSFYDEQKTGQLMSRLTNDLLSLTELYHHGPEDIVISTVKFIGAFVILLSINVNLTLVVFLFLPILAVYSFYFYKKMHFALKRNKERIGDINAQVEENLAGMRVVKSFANEEIEKAKFAYENRRFLESRKEGYKFEAVWWQGIGGFSQLIIVALIVFGGISIVNATLDLADLIVFLLYIGSLIDPIQKFIHFANQYQEGVTGFERFMEIMELEPEIQDSPEAIELKEVQGHVQFIDVGFRYKEDHYFVLKNISLDIQAGDYIALVGTSGVGKTTLCSLIPRFYEINEGKILLDGIDIRDIRLSALRRSIGVVQQDVYLFAGTVLENIRYGKPGASLEEIISAAKKAHAHDFIMDLPQRYDTEVGQRGVKLSGGQKQRLSIARVFLKDPPVLIFDEATSSLDNESERVVQESLESLAVNRTTLVIAHRLSTIRNARRIVVLTEDGIDEQGTHEELMRRNGVYSHFYNLSLSPLSIK